MDFVYRYAVLQVTPDIRRGERVNVGIVVFKPDGLDIRISETRKIRAITAGSWDAEIEAFTSTLTTLDNSGLESKDRIEAASVIENQFSLRKTGWFKAKDALSYEFSVNEITQTLILKPRPVRHSEGSSVSAEISRELRKADILASKALVDAADAKPTKRGPYKKISN